MKEGQEDNKLFSQFSVLCARVNGASRKYRMASEPMGSYLEEELQSISRSYMDENSWPQSGGKLWLHLSDLLTALPELE